MKNKNIKNMNLILHIKEWEIETLTYTKSVYSGVTYDDRKKILSIYLQSLYKGWSKKSCIRETKNLSTDADSRSDTILEVLRDLSKNKN